MTLHTNKNPCSPRAPRLTVLAFSLCGIAAAHAQDATQTLQSVTVSGASTPDYKPETASVGPLGSQALLDTPYAINVVPAELIQNQQLKSVREAFRYLPSVQGENIRPQTRGLQAGVVQNTRIDGLAMASTTDYPLEQFERIEVLNGLAGALYGPANPAGTFNYVLKRPTDDKLRRVSLGYASQASKSAAVDLGGKFGSERQLGYRINALDDSGEGYVDGSHLSRKLLSVAFDIHFNADTVLETNGSRYHYTAQGFPGTFQLNSASVRFPDAPDPKRVGYGQSWAGDDNLTDTFSARLKHQFNQHWSLSAGLQQQDSDRASTVPTNLLTNNLGAYTVRTATTTFTLDRILSNTVALNGRVDTGAITHDLVLANTGFDWDRYRPYTVGAITVGAANLANPASFNQPPLPDFKNRYNALTTRQQSLTLGDTLHFGPQWSAGAFVSQSWIDVDNKNATGKTTSQSNDSGVSSNLTLAYKPRSDMTVYGTYADSLQQGDFAPAGPLNADHGLPAYRSKQWELGYKFSFDRMELSAAAFRIERPFAFTANNVFAVQGDQVNRGVELMANGAVTNNLSVYGGVTYLDPRLHHTGVASTENTQIMGLSRVVANLLLDYRLAAVPGLFINFNANHAGQRQGNSANTYQIAGYTVLDLGARYTTRLLGHSTTWRLALSNLGDKRYWANITPNGQNGYSGTAADNGAGTLGAPRMVRASMQIDW